MRVTRLAPRFAQLKVLGETLRLDKVQLSVLPLLMSAGEIVPEPNALRATVAFLQAIVGGIRSTTVTTAEQVLVFPLPSLAVKTTVLGPKLAQVNVFAITETRFTTPQCGGARRWSLLPARTAGFDIWRREWDSNP